jgi:hypothetical protein
MLNGHGGQRPISPIETEAITSSDDEDPAEAAARARRERAPAGALVSVNEEAVDAGPSAWLLSSEDEAEDSAGASAEEPGDAAAAQHALDAAAHARRGTELVPPAIAPIALPEVIPAMALEPMPPALAEEAPAPVRADALRDTDAHVSVAEFDAILAADAAAEAAAAYSETSSDGGDEALSRDEEEAELAALRARLGSAAQRGEQLPRRASPEAPLMPLDAVAESSDEGPDAGEWIGSGYTRTHSDEGGAEEAATLAAGGPDAGEWSALRRATEFGGVPFAAAAPPPAASATAAPAPAPVTPAPTAASANARAHAAASPSPRFRRGSFHPEASHTELKSAVRAEFDKYDEDGSGTISLSEMTVFLTATFAAAMDHNRAARHIQGMSPRKVSVLLCTVTFYANHAHNLTRSP